MYSIPDEIIADYIISTEPRLRIRAVSGHAHQLSRISGARMSMDMVVRAMHMRDLINTEYAPCTSAFEWRNALDVRSHCFTRIMDYAGLYMTGPIERYFS